MKELGVSAFKAAQMAGISYTCVYRNVKKLRDAGQDIPNHRRVKEKKS
jgi:transposase